MPPSSPNCRSSPFRGQHSKSGVHESVPWVRIPPAAPKEEPSPSGGGSSFGDAFRGIRTRGHLARRRWRLATRGGLPRRAGRIPPAAPAGNPVHSDGVFAGHMFGGIRTRGLLARRRWRLATRGGLPRRAGRIPPAAPRQKKLTPFRFHGFCKSRESFISVSSFFLSKTEVSRGTSVLVSRRGIF